MTSFDELFADVLDLELDSRTRARHLAYFDTLYDGTENAYPGDELAARRKRRRGFLIGGAVVVLVAGGTATAAALGAFSATHTSTAWCYSSDSLDSSRREYTTGDTNGGNSAAQGLDSCREYWQSGVFQAGRAATDDPPTGSGHPVPDLVACVLPDGGVGIFPGTTATCTALGLPPYG